MQVFVDSHPVEFWFSIFIPLWLTLGYLIALLGGWRTLAGRYRTDRQFPAHKRWMQSGQMRLGTGYRSILTLGSDDEGIYMGVLFPFRVGHPPLLVPWGDIRVHEMRRLLGFIKMRTLMLGPDGIPLRVGEGLAQFLMEARGAESAASTGMVSSTF